MPRAKYRFGTLEPRDEGSCRLVCRTDWLDGVALYLAGLGVDFEIEEPPELVDRIERLAARFAAAALGKSP
jgi:predicted DNA-binding transcriptional regulator YafY